MPTPVSVARPYAQAVFDLAREDNTLRRWSTTLAQMADMVTIPEMAAAIANPAIERALLLGILFEAAGHRLGRYGRNFLGLVMGNGRTALLPLIAEQYDALLAEAERRSVARIESARPLSAEQRQRLRDRLEAALGHSIVLDNVVDEMLVGGMTIRIGDRMIDGSAMGRLRDLARWMR